MLFRCQSPLSLSPRRPVLSLPLAKIWIPCQCQIKPWIAIAATGTLLRTTRRSLTRYHAAVDAASHALAVPPVSVFALIAVILAQTPISRFTKRSKRVTWSTAFGGWDIVWSPAAANFYAPWPREATTTSSVGTTAYKTNSIASMQSLFSRIKIGLIIPSSLLLLR